MENFKDMKRELSSGLNVENVPTVLRVRDESDEHFFSEVAQLVTDTWSDGFFGEIVFTIGDSCMMVDGTQQMVDSIGQASPVIVDNKVLLPVSALIERVGGVILIDAQQQNISIKYDRVIKMEVDSYVVYVDGKMQNVETAPLILNDSALLAIDIISEILGFEVDWNPATQRVTLTRDFQTKRLILRTSTEIELTKLGAKIAIKGPDNIVALQFATIGETQAAYKRLSELAAIVWVEPDLFTPHVGLVEEPEK